jgi:hypothetical protein
VKYDDGDEGFVVFGEDKYRLLQQPQVVDSTVAKENDHLKLPSQEYEAAQGSTASTKKAHDSGSPEKLTSNKRKEPEEERSLLKDFTAEKKTKRPVHGSQGSVR